MKLAQERLLSDAIHDNLTSLPNRELYIDRLSSDLVRSKVDNQRRPAVFLVDLDRFRQVNETLGLSVGDTILLTLARRLGRLVKPLDTLSRIEGDRFGIVLVSEQASDRLAAFADTVKRAVRAPIVVGEKEVFLTASIGIAVPDADDKEARTLVQDAEIALAFAKKLGGDRIETFRPALRIMSADLTSLEQEPAQRHRQGRADGALPAGHSGWRPVRGRLRSAPALEPSAQGLDPAGRVHADRRALRSRGTTGHVPARPGCTTTGRLAAITCPSAIP